MRKVELTPDNLQEIKQYRGLGMTWKKIQDKTGIDRRIAKREYETWEQYQSSEELKSARVEVARDLFRDHIDHLAATGWHLASKLETVRLPTDVRSAQGFLDDMWVTQILTSVDYKAVPKKERPGIIRADNLALIDALKQHTHDAVPWSLLNVWGESWDCVGAAFCNIAKQRESIAASCAGPGKELTRSTDDDEGSSTHDPLLQSVWNVVMQVGPGAVTSGWVEGLSPQVKQSVFQDIVRTLVPIITSEVYPSDEIGVLKKLAGTTPKIANEMAGYVVDILVNMERMRDSRARLRMALSPLRTKPVLLQTRCDLCPA